MDFFEQRGLDCIDQPERTTMRCMSIGDFDLSQSSLHDSPLKQSFAIVHNSMKIAACDNVGPTTDTPALNTADLSSSLQKQIMSIKPDSDHTEKNSDSSTLSPCCPVNSKRSLSSSFSTLNTIDKAPSSAFSSTSSLNVSESESENSRTSTIKTSFSSGSSLSTIPDEFHVNTVSSGLPSTFTDMKPSDDRNSAKISQRLRESFQSNTTLMDMSKPKAQILNTTTERESQHRITLPERYRHALRKSGSHGHIGGDKGQDLQSREKDLGTALAWIRNEMVQMREQDSLLLKRFIELRTNILQLRCTMIHQAQGSSSDLHGLGGSSLSLNEGVRSSYLRTLARADSDVMMSGRMYAMASSLSLPCSPQLSRLER